MKLSNDKNDKQITMPLYKLLILLFITVFLTSVVTFASYKFCLNYGNNKQKNINKIEKVYKQIEGDYYKDVDEDKVTKDAIDGIVKSINDPYSEYISDEDTKSYNQESSVDLVGIGAEMESHNNNVRITSPMIESHAEKASIKPIDVITKVNNKSI